jgi:acyl phosphate:glycerol-3-phosphate acyltransferase
MLTFHIILVSLIGYVLGSVPFAVIIARRHGIDILKEGSGNPGATNVKRVVGKSAGDLCFMLDMLKGIVAAGWPMLAFHGDSHVAALGVLGLIAALVGHSFSMFIHFKGGKGVATTIGGMLALCPLVIIVGVLIWLAVFYWKRYVSLASLCMAASLPVGAWIFGEAPIIFWITLLLAVLLFVRHRANIVRLYHGTESKFEKKTSE